MKSREAILADQAEFTWMFNQNFFVESAKHGNFIWKDPEYGGDNTLTQTSMSYKEFSKLHGGYGRDKGRHIISRYTGDDVIIKL